MRRRRFLSTALLLPLAARADERGSIRAAVINGMVMTGLWPALVERFAQAVELAATGERPVLDSAFRAGGIDLLVMHSGDITTNLVADGIATDLRPWARNELIIAGPAGDPAGLRGLHDGAAALRQLIEKGGRLVDFRDIGSREVLHTLIERAEVEPGDWLIPDRAPDKRGILAYAAAQRAYAIVGSIPIRTGRMAGEGMGIVVEGDARMRRPYVVMTANPRRWPAANHAGARAFADFLLAPATQRFLGDFGRGRGSEEPFFYPVAAEAWSSK